MANVATAIVTIQNKLGLHARPVTLFVETASQFDADIRVRRADGENGGPVDGKSIMQMMLLAATCGTDLEITADGPESDAAIEALQKLVDSNFDEE